MPTPGPGVQRPDSQGVKSVHVSVRAHIHTHVFSLLSWKHMKQETPEGVYPFYLKLYALIVPFQNILVARTAVSPQSMRTGLLPAEECAFSGCSYG